ncbi:MAG: ferredoxin--NADP(+) reductase [Candidatus Puniceispirillum sp.]|nr:ferredoxin--NADP(+) reductase [Candidatus Pelagibacter sp.]MBA4283425.1 ferredoxin--NADP(+) reductase [Candidatus Puniceispirillum sp.]
MIYTDVVVIGAGPVGLFAVFECGMQRLKCCLFDSLDHLGGQCAALYPEKPIYDIPTHSSITGEDLVNRLIDQMKVFEPQIFLKEQIEKLEKNEDQTFKVTGSRGTVVRCKAVVIAAGVGAFGPNRPPLEGIEHYEGQSVLYSVLNREQYRDKKVVIAGGGDSAVDWALSLSEIASDVTVVHRRSKFRCLPESQKQLEELASVGKIQLAVPYQLSQLKGDNAQITHVGISTIEGEYKEIEADFLLPFFGLSMNLGPILDWDLALSKNCITVDPSTSETSVPGVFAVGDISTYKNKQKLILTGFAEAALAAKMVRQLLYPDEVVHFEYSTSQGIPQI